MAAGLQRCYLKIVYMQYVPLLIGLIILALVIWHFVQQKRGKMQVQQAVEPTIEDRKFLEQHIEFYQKLTIAEKKVFEEKLETFLASVRITGVKTEVTQQDCLMVAAGAIIPIFRFDDWQYRNLHEVLLYPGQFSREFQLEGEEINVLGMVGEGAMQNVMVLSQPALRHGFGQHSQPTNTAIHEFVHLLDKSDGATDGLPEYLLPSDSVKPWLQWMHKEIEKIKGNDSDIDPYGATNEAEFLAVASEYFFTQPEKLEEKHPELYQLLTKIFQTEKEVVE